MKPQLVVTIVSPDRPGLVDLVSEVIAKHGANWESSRMVRLGGRFAGVLLATAGAGDVEQLTNALEALGTSDMSISVARADAPAPSEGLNLSIQLVGQDRPGIVHDISAALAQRHINVEELHTDCSDAPMAGGQLFTLRAELRCGADLDVTELRDTLEALAHDLMVDISLAAG